MPFNAKDVFTTSTPYLILISAIGGCLIRYLDDYKRTNSIKVSWLFADLLVSSFLGYLTFWFLAENTDFTISLCAIATCIAGNLGSKIFDIIRFILFKKLEYTEEK